MKKLGIYRGYIQGASAARFTNYSYMMPIAYMTRPMELDEDTQLQYEDLRVDYEVTISSAPLLGFVEVLIKLCANEHTPARADLILLKAQISQAVLIREERTLEAIGRLIDAVLLA